MMRHKAFLAAAIALVLAACGKVDDRPIAVPQEALPAAHPGQMVIPGEARVLSGVQPTRFSHPIRQLYAVWGYDRNGAIVRYRQGRDFVARADGIARVAGSRIPDFARYHPTYGANGTFAVTIEPRSPPLSAPWIVYTAYAPGGRPAVLRPYGYLGAVKRVICVGDSITAGAHTTARLAHDSASGAYCALLGRNLPGIRFTSISKGGSTLGDFVDMARRPLPGSPRAAIIAFGMNDQMGGSAGLATFRMQLETVIWLLQRQRIAPVMVGFFQQNPQWELQRPDQTVAYNRVIADVAGRHGIPFIDAGAAFAAAAPPDEPAFRHLTADFLHHPNDFGQRIYMSLLLPLFLDRPRSAAEFPDYVHGPWTNAMAPAP